MNNVVKALLDDLTMCRKQVKQLNERIKTVEKALGYEFAQQIQQEEPIEYDTENANAKLVYTRRLDMNKLSNFYPYDKAPQLYKPVLDTNLVREYIPRVELKKYEKTSMSWKVTAKNEH